MIKFDFDKFCYGCEACKNICPKNAITMEKNKQGFLIPKIDMEKCINCGLCEKKCPYLNFQKNNNIYEKEWYAGYIKDITTREKSTSGGIFYQIAKEFINQDGYVCGCIWNENLNPIHIVTNKESDIDKMRGAKYVQSNMNGCHTKIKEILKLGKKVLFSGTPCQVSSIKSYVENNENLYTCSIICEGVATNKIWDIYKNKLEEDKKAKLKEVYLRSKKNGWNKPVAHYKFDNGQEVITLSYGWDKYVIGFLEGLYNRESCYNCQYKGDGHNADIIIGDFWGANREQIEKSANKGLSVIILNTTKGQNMIDYNKSDIELLLIDKDIAINNNQYLMKPMVMSDARKKFMSNIENITTKNINKEIKKYTKYNYKKGFLKEILFKLNLLK